jgi:hypothetical protein
MMTNEGPTYTSLEARLRPINYRGPGPWSALQRIIGDQGLQRPYNLTYERGPGPGPIIGPTKGPYNNPL